MHAFHQLTDAISVDGVAQFDLRSDFVTFGHCHVAHVVAEASNLQLLSVMPGAGRPRPRLNFRVNICIAPGTDDNLARKTHSGSNEPEFPVAMS